MPIGEDINIKFHDRKVIANVVTRKSEIALSHLIQLKKRNKYTNGWLYTLRV